MTSSASDVGDVGERPRTGPNGERLTVCSACGAPIYFRHNPATGKYTPIALATGESHFRDCSSPRLFSKNASKKRGGEGS